MEIERLYTEEDFLLDINQGIKLQEDSDVSFQELTENGLWIVNNSSSVNFGMIWINPDSNLWSFETQYQIINLHKIVNGGGYGVPRVTRWKCDIKNKFISYNNVKNKKDICIKQSRFIWKFYLTIFVLYIIIMLWYVSIQF